MLNLLTKSIIFKINLKLKYGKPTNAKNLWTKISLK